MPHRLPTPPRWLRLTLVAVRAGTLSVAALVGLSALTGAGLDPGGGSTSSFGHRPAAVQEMIEQHRCSTTGFERDEPTSAIVRSLDGRLRLVAFERAWQLFTSHGAASLVAVCLDPPDA
ncbi:hypothetical protein [Nocardioides sp. YIM 152315]|uniref:hypothetical protein n=1 Tax=Nocardioides sp. YIM 152315 TaxID=3031760 RepID=UPI0023DC73E9|nr:hypothetical protein [Nocardioides sp. YIM 152315]MDF1605267.1 hypothetical protein [Nocardioides sp. YIM 152315]